MPTIEPVTLEIVADDQKELLAVVAQNGLQPETAQNLQSTFAPLFSQARAVMDKSKVISVTDISQKLEIKLARAFRLELRAIRVASDKTRKELKDESLKKGKAIDGFHNILLHLVEAEEKRLDEQEQFAERKEAERKALVKGEREALLKPYAVDCALFQLAEMSQETFDQLLAGTKLAHEARAEAARKAEAERVARETAAAEEQARIKAENERLKKEAEEREAAMKAERERVAKEQAAAAEKARVEREAAEKVAAAERAEIQRKADEAAEIARKEREAIEVAAAEERRVAQEARWQAEVKASEERKAAEEVARKEREAREKLEAEKRQSEEKAAAELAAQQEVTRKAAAAPDKEKLLAFALAIETVKFPELSSPEGIAASAKMIEQHGKYVKWINEKVATL